MNSPHDKFKFNQLMPTYLKELSQLSIDKFDEKYLATPEVTEKIRKEVKRSELKKKIEIFFEEKEAERFRCFVNNLHEHNKSPIYIWTERSNTCGIYEISSVIRFNFGFPFTVNHEGVIVLMAKNLTDEMILDFYDDFDKKKKLEIELFGPNWSNVNY